MNVYYTGLTGELTLQDSRNQIRRLTVDRDRTIAVPIALPAGDFG